MRYVTASDSTIGLREVNQDRYAEFTLKGVKAMILCDGNGENGGQIIADRATKSVVGEAVYRLSQLKQVSPEILQHIGEKAISRTAENIKNLKTSCPDLSSCGTTLTLVFIHKSTVITFWVGDSPAVLYKNDMLLKLTNPPHTLAERLIAQGGSRESIEKQSSLSSSLTRCIGFKDTKPSLKVVTFKPPFSVMIASDGIDYIPENKLKDIFDQTYGQMCLPGKIIISALEHNSSDNITVVATKVKAQPKLKIRSKRICRQKCGGLRYV